MSKVKLFFVMGLLGIILTFCNMIIQAKNLYVHAYPSTSGALHVEGSRLIDSHGNQIQLKGISTHGLAWFPEYINQELFEQLRYDWDVNVIRLAMYTAEYGGYCTDGDREYLKALIKDGVEFATANDMYVIVDWHILSDGNPNTYISEAIDFFDEMSETFKNRENIIYEICNEPNGGVSWRQIKSYAEEIIEVIRRHDTDAIIVVGTPNWSQFVDQAAADPILEYENIMYTLHYYAATHGEDLRNRMKIAVESGLPIFVTEYGICDASGNGVIDEAQADAWVDLMNDYGISYVAWNLSNKDETSAIIKKECVKKNELTISDLSQSGRWLYEMLTGEKSEAVEEVNQTEEKNKASYLDNIQQEELKISAEIKNTWESEGEFFYQYDLVIQNVSDAEINGWKICIPFTGDFSLSDGWKTKLCESYKRHYGKELDIPRWMDIKSKYIK